MTAIGLWLVSLALPGFIAGTDVWYGHQILLAGLTVGILSGSLAAYANVFFALVARKLWQNRTAGWTVVAMLALGATAPFFGGVLIDEGGTGTSSVTSWGWGAILWGLSLLVLALAALARWVKIGRLAIWAFSVLAIAGLSWIAAVNVSQLEQANAQEREVFLPPGIAYTKWPFCDVPLVWPDPAPVADDVVVALDIDPRFRNSYPEAEGPYFFIPAGLNIQEDGYDTINIPWSFGISIRFPAQPRPLLQLHAVGNGGDAVLRILDASRTRVMYEQRLRIRGAPGRPYFCPLASNGGSMNDRIEFSYDNAIRRVLGVQAPKPWSGSLRSEVTATPCNPRKLHAAADGWFDWDGRTVRFGSDSGRRSAWCSDTYIANVSATEYQTGAEESAAAFITIFERDTLKILRFYRKEGQPCDSQLDPNCSGRSLVAPRDIKSVRISDVSVVLETSIGDLTALPHDGFRYRSLGY